MPRTYHTFTHEERVAAFWRKVNKNGPIPAHRPELGPCWLWTAATGGAGYGTFHGDSGRTEGAHCFSYRTEVGPIPKGFDVDHLCRTRLCVRPTHLEAVTRIENLRRSPTICTLNGLKTHCKNGHPFDETNTATRPLGRGCRACDAAAARRKRRDGRKRGVCEFCGFASWDLAGHLRKYGRHPHVGPGRKPMAMFRGSLTGV